MGLRKVLPESQPRQGHRWRRRFRDVIKLDCETVVGVRHRARSFIEHDLDLRELAIPLGFVGYAQHIRHTTGINWISALAVLVALSLVIATAVISSRK